MVFVEMCFFLFDFFLYNEHFAVKYLDECAVISIYEYVLYGFSYIFFLV